MGSFFAFSPFRRFAFSLYCCAALFISCTEDEHQMSEGLFDETHVLEMRHKKDEAFHNAETSPIPAASMGRFEGLHYYDPNDDYAVAAVFKHAVHPDTITMQTTTSELRQMVREGVFEFSLGGKPLHLTAYRFEGATKDDEFFIPFKDQTNGLDTYETGRYLDVSPIEDDSAYVLDFNEAYNPYCAYSDAYSCPLVPKENNLPISVEAGEKKWR